MKYIRKVSKEEMEKKFPDFMKAFTSENQENVFYCNTCDGIRIFENGKCTACSEDKYSGMNFEKYEEMHKISEEDKN